VSDVPEARPLAEGVMMARDRFLTILLKHGVERISPEGQPFDPNESEALRVDPVDSKDRDQTVTETLKPGYRLGARVIRAAQVAVGRYTE
jgi:molecular chaperone GrpE